jgi:hypothetical protein
MLAKRNGKTISKHQGRNLLFLLEEGEKVVTGITSIYTRLTRAPSARRNYPCWSTTQWDLSRLLDHVGSLETSSNFSAPSEDFLRHQIVKRFGSLGGCIYLPPSLSLVLTLFALKKQNRISDAPDNQFVSMGIEYF